MKNPYHKKSKKKKNSQLSLASATNVKGGSAGHGGSKAHVSSGKDHIASGSTPTKNENRSFLDQILRKQ